MKPPSKPLILFTLLFIYCSCTLPSAITNLLHNGNFLHPILTENWRYIKHLPHWKIEHQIEQGFGNVYNPRWGRTIVIELDSNCSNDYLSQNVHLLAGVYEIEFQYAARVGWIHSSGMSVWWNGKLIKTILGADDCIYGFRERVEGKLGANTLEIRGEGIPDSYGMTIGNVWLYRSPQQVLREPLLPTKPVQPAQPILQPHQPLQPLLPLQPLQPIRPLPSVQPQLSGPNFFNNPNFDLPTRQQGFSILTNLPGWQTEQIEQGIGNIYNHRWGTKTVIELDGNINSVITQTLNLQPGSYRFELIYAARTGYVQSSGLYIAINDEVYEQVLAQDEEIRKVEFVVQVKEAGLFEFEIGALGTSDSYGMTVGGVSLVPVQGVSQGRLCYPKK